MARMALVTDGSCDLTRQISEENSITVVPLTVHFGDESYTDGVDISSSEFFHKLRTYPMMPKTSQPSPADFIAVYERLLETHDYIISLHISSKMSGTIQSARIAADSVRPDAIEVIDSNAVSLVTGLMLLAAAEAIDEGKSVDEVRAAIEHVKQTYGLYWTLDTLEYLQKNGRIGKGTAFIGGLLSIKPIMSIDDGEICGVERVRGAGKVYPRIMALMGSRIDPGQEIDLIVLHADDEARGREWLADVTARFNCRRTWMTECGPIVGTHAGPGTMAVAWYPVVRD